MKAVLKNKKMLHITEDLNSRTIACMIITILLTKVVNSDILYKLLQSYAISNIVGHNINQGG